MPTYEYRCQECKGLFNIVLSMAEHGQGGVTCPDCGSSRVVQQFSVFYAKTSKKS